MFRIGWADICSQEHRGCLSQTRQVDGKEIVASTMVSVVNICLPDPPSDDCDSDKALFAAGSCWRLWLRCWRSFSSTISRFIPWGLCSLRFSWRSCGFGLRFYLFLDLRGGHIAQEMLFRVIAFSTRRLEKRRLT